MGADMVRSSVKEAARFDAVAGRRLAPGEMCVTSVWSLPAKSFCMSAREAEPKPNEGELGRCE